MDHDYYATLGLYPGAEDVVIRAAFKALAQRYHPDRFDGPRDVAEARMKEINVAYAVLSDPEKRAAYDRQRAASSEPEGMGDDASEATFSDAARGLDADWAVALDYYPDLEKICQRLTKFSPRLSFAFRVAMLEQRDFEKRSAIRAAMEQEFLVRYFGEQPGIRKFALELILEGRREAAMELNKAVKVLGNNADASRIIQRIKDRFELSKPVRPQNNDNRREPTNLAWGQRLLMLVRSFHQHQNEADVLRILKHIEGRLTFGRSGISVHFRGKEFEFADNGGLFEWVNDALIPQLQTEHPDIRWPAG